MVLIFAFLVKESRSEDSDEEDDEEESEPSVEPTIDAGLEPSSPPAPAVTATPRSSTPESPKGTTILCERYVAQPCSRISRPASEAEVAFPGRGSQTYLTLPVHPQVAATPIFHGRSYMCYPSSGAYSCTGFVVLHVAPIDRFR